MTNKEAISILQDDAYLLYEDDLPYNRQAYDMAISALEQEPCDDAISRKSVINTIDNMDNALDENRTVEEYKALLKECYEVLPPVRPQEKTGHWINDEDTIGCYYCSECGGYVASYDDAYCKYCGCRMVEPHESVCEKCLYAEETDGSHCYECVKGESKYEPQESENAVKSCNTCKHSDKPYSEEPCKHCCDDVAEKWESEDK